MDTASNATHVMNDLIQTCIDGQKGFEAAAKAVEDAMIKDELVGYSWQRQQFATELTNRLVAFGGEPTEHGSGSAMLHRGWMDVKSALTGGKSHSVLAECERGEDSAVQAYKDALDKALPAEFSQVVQNQYETIQRTHDRIKQLRDTTDHN